MCPKAPSSRGLSLPIVLIAALAADSSLRGDTVTLNPVKDNTIYSESGDLSNGVGSYYFAGKTGGGNVRRALVAFSVAGSIPAGSTINTVTLEMYMSRTQAGNETVWLHRLLADWGEGTSNADQQEGAGDSATYNDATWFYRFYDVSNPSTSPAWTSPGGDYADSPSASAFVGGNGTYTWGSTSTMVSDVQGWLTLPAENFGWIVIGNEVPNTTSKRFESRHNAQTSRRPRLLINFTPPTATGTCCFANGTCQLQTQSNCIAMSGSYQGNATSCTPNPCAQPTGACCNNNGTCQVLSQSDCVTQSGTYQGDSTPCTPNLCPIVLTPYLDELPIPPLATPTNGVPGGAATYDMNIVQVQQQLHAQLPPTTLWTYEGMYPGPTILATSGVPITVNWINDLPPGSHYLPVDSCPHGAADVPKVVTHLHGGHVPAAVDGYPESTFLPGNSVTYVYPNNQPSSLIWYHDHALGITRLNVYMGLAGGYVITDAFEQALNLPAGEYDVPLIVQDRSFNPDGTLMYPDIWQEHFFGDKMLVNGKVWPFLRVNQGKYRFRVLNGCNSRVLTLSLSNGQSFQQIGTDGGLLPAAATLTQVTLGGGERADLVVDFAGSSPGTEIILGNSAPAPFPFGDPMHDIPNVMKFVVQNQPGDTDPVPAPLRPIEPLDPQDVAQTRAFMLQKTTDPCSGQVWLINGMHWDHIHEQPMLGTTEIWSFINRSGISHPMHMHLVFFQVLDRQDYQIVAGQVVPIGIPVPPAANEAGWKDTVLTHPAQITRVIARFMDYTGRYPYHCHILEHEDHEMMRQFEAVCMKGDTNQDTKVDGGDIQEFVEMLLSGGPIGTAAYCATDMDDNGALAAGLDVPLFVNCLTSGFCP